ncbi:dynamin family protein [Kurthia sp. FSL E2-0154]|uniref:dynamin family protein n=1 Tax=Kurthia sp. FSL E2-0154 TaxID=2921358 RepID=UPI0030FCD853
MEKNNHTQYEKRIQQIECSEQPVLVGEKQQLQRIQFLLSKHMSTRITARKLRELIADSKDDLKLLVIGDVYANKATFINTLLNRHVMPSEYHGVSYVHTIIHYGEKESVTAHFLDGQVAQFSLGQVELFAISDTFSSQMMRSGLDYVDIVLKHDLLKAVTIFDTPSYQKSVFVKESFLKRSQAVVWLANHQFKGLPSERTLLARIGQEQKEMLFVLNEDPYNLSSGILEKQDFFGVFKQLSVSFQALQEAVEKDEDALYQSSNFDQLFAYIQMCRLDNEAFSNLIHQRFFEWVDRFILEIRSLVQRDPYLEAYNMLREFMDESDNAVYQSKEQEYKIHELEKTFEQLKKEYHQLETSYQLIEFLKAHTAELPKSKKLIQLYTEYASFVQQYKRGVSQQLFTDPEQKREEVVRYEQQFITYFKEQKSALLHEIQQLFIEIEKQILEIENQSEYRVVRLEKAAKRLQAFDPIVQAKTEITSILEQKTMYEDVPHLLKRIKEINMDYAPVITYFEEKKKQLAVEDVQQKQAVYQDILDELLLEMTY